MCVATLLGHFLLFDIIKAYLIHRYVIHIVLRLKLGFRSGSAIVMNKIKIFLLIVGPKVELRVKCLNFKLCDQECKRKLSDWMTLEVWGGNYILKQYRDLINYTFLEGKGVDFVVPEVYTIRVPFGGKKEMYISNIKF